MKYLIILALLLAILPGKSKPKKSKSRRPWYDIHYEDMITYDVMDDGW